MWNDLRFALRTLRHSPGFTLLAILSLALGIGANTAIFSLVYQVIIRALPVRDPGALFSLASDERNFGTTRRDNNQTVFSYPMYQALRDRNQAFTGLIARSSFPATLAYHGDAASVTAEVVTGNFFDVLGTRPALGRLLVPADDAASGANPVIILSYAYWISHLGADAAILNARVLMNGQPVLVAGVAPRGFRGLLTGRDPDFFVPVSMMAMISSGWEANHQVDTYWLSLVGRLKPGVSRRRAEAMLLPLFRAELQDELPHMQGADQDTRQKILAKPLTLHPAAQGINALRAEWQTPLVILTVMVGLVLLIACANVANLLVARATARQREIAIRLAVGATRWQLVRQLMVESGVLAAAGGLLGLLLSANLTDGLLSMLPSGTTGGWLAPQLDIRLLCYAMVLSLATGLLFGIAPALQALRPGVASALKAQTAGMSASGSQSRTRQGLMVIQICISLSLLIGAGLFTRSLWNLMHSNPGFRADHLVTFSIDPSLSGYNVERRLALFRSVSEKLRSLPGVKSAASGWLAPLGGSNWGTGLKAPGTPRASEKYVDCAENSVSPGYFSTLGIPLMAGREFSSKDNATSPKVAIINETFARFLFDQTNPIGRHVLVGGGDTDTQIVGIVKDSRFSDLREEPAHFIYVPFEQGGGDDFIRRSAFFVRTSGNDAGMMAAVRESVKQLDRNLPIERLTSMETTIDNAMYAERLMSMLAIAFGLLAALLAAVGLYGTVSYTVARRTREFGIRLVLGAAPHSLLLSVMREVGWLIAIGVAVGLPASLALSRLAESEFFGVRAYDPWAIGAALLLILIVGLLAGLVPALRAMRIEPMRALRYE